MNVVDLVKAVIAAAAILVGLSTTWIFKMPKDNAIEQVAEEVIKEDIGVSVDLSPTDT